MTALTELAKALRDRTTLGWCVKHAPDGDADGALKRAWETEPRGGPVLAVAVLGRHPIALNYALAVALGDRPTADELRRNIPRPAFAELTRTLTRDDLGRVR